LSIKVGTRERKQHSNQEGTYVGDLDLVTFLQMLSELGDEISGRYVFDGVSVLVNEGEVLLKVSR
jgi:hypothetical protein